MLPVLHPDAAGIDIGAEEIYVAVPDRAEHSVRSSEHLRVTCMICATGLATTRFELLLETRGFEVFLANASHVKNVPGRKSDSPILGMEKYFSGTQGIARLRNIHI